MTTANLIINRVQNKIEKDIDFFNLSTKNLKLISFSFIVIIFLLLIFYVWQINSLSYGSYLIKKQENTITQLLEKNRELKIYFTEKNYLEKILTKTKELNFQKAESIKYINVLEDYAKVASEKF